ncbi:hypothetical protein MKY59_21315 [Paenibacillus sp. FSL W8-0426]|uniref:phage tail assembly chaperone n=1 Tax=Paenibacillus sp. FSL W8-0426 TaxID=2921714 RepID=UPI0030DAC930
MAKGLEALLGASLDVTKEVYIPRLKTHFTLKTLTNADVQRANLRATTGKGNIDMTQLSYALISAACVDPDFNNKALKAHYGATDELDCVGKALLPGEVKLLVDELTKMSDLGVSDEAVEDAKN